MGLFNTKPAREAATKNVVADLDKLIAEPVAFRFNGKAHLIKPITTAEFFKITSELAKMDALRKKDTIDNVELIDAYVGLLTAACDTLKREDIENMTQAQVGALFQLVLDCVTGRSFGASEEKKNTSLAHH
jgi:hypothetical protein